MSILSTSIKTILIMVTLLVLIFLAILFLSNCKNSWCQIFQWQKVKMVNSFEDCIFFNFPVSTSSPRQCEAGNKIFTEPVKYVGVYGDMIRVTNPKSGALIKSPLTVTGEARGNWYFEASFPIKLIDSNGKEIAVTHAQAKSDWMTTDFVPFESTVIFENPTTETGTLILEKDNPSGLPENSKYISIPIRFEITPNVVRAGNLSGTISIGPVCPVERVDNPCKPTPEMYAAQKIFIYLPDKKTLLKTLIPNENGEFSTTLPEGSYWLDTNHQSIGSVTGAPINFKVGPNISTIITISIDTGIR